MNLAFTEVVSRTVFSLNFLRMLANGPPLFGSGVLESILSSAAGEEAGSSCGVVTDWDIMQTCQCIVHPLTSHFYIAELGFTGVYTIFLILALKQRLLVLVTSTPIYVLSKNKKRSQFFILKLPFYSREIL